MIGKSVIRWGGGSLLAAATVLAVGAGTARAAPAPVPALGTRLHANLTPVAAATGSGRFDALLVKTGPFLAGGPVPGSNVSPPTVCPPSPLMIPCRAGGGGGVPPFQIPPVPPTGVHWLLVWRLVLTGVTGPAKATVHLGVQGAASPILSTLCSSCRTVARGHMKLTGDQAQQLLKGNGTVDVQAASGELTGKIGVGTHFLFTARAARK